MRLFRREQHPRIQVTARRRSDVALAHHIGKGATSMYAHPAVTKVGFELATDGIQFYVLCPYTLHLQNCAKILPFLSPKFSTFLRP